MRAVQGQIVLFGRAQWVLAGFLVAAFCGFYFVGYRPTINQLADLHERINTKRRDLAFSQSKALDLEALRMKVDKLQVRVEKSGKKLPKEPELGQFIADLYQVGTQSALQGFQVMPDPAKRMSLFYELPIKMKFEGDFTNAALFLEKVEDLQRLTRVKSLSVVGRSDAKGNSKVDVDLVMNIYFAE